MGEVHLTIDGQAVTCKKGTMVLQAALDADIFIPHYCYHPSLSVAGNCRMCMVEIVPKLKPGQKPRPQKPAIGCATEAMEGMEILTRSEMVLEARRGVLESLLVNHPLDCPICDQAGECDLQDFSFRSGQGQSRFEDPKRTKHTKDIGPEVRLYGNRCINCTRCVRFSQEISGTADISQVNRGGRNVVDVFPGLEFDNPLSGNVVDLCPVGALVSRDFLHRSRVWQLDREGGVCPHCATGCSIEVHTRDDVIMRLKPRHNPEVNGHWMCDTGRAGYAHVHAPDRLRSYRIGAGEARRRASFHEAASLLAAKLAEAGEKTYVLVSPWLTNEELYALRQLVPAERMALIERPSGEEQRFFPTWGDSERNPALAGQHDRCAVRPDGATFVISADKNPNRRGLEAVLGTEVTSEKRREEVLAAVRAGKADVLFVLSAMPGYEPPTEILEATQKAAFVAALDISNGPLAQGADLVLPGAAFCEHEGTYTSGDGVTQRLRVALPPAGQTRPALELLYVVATKLEAAAASGAEPGSGTEPDTDSDTDTDAGADAGADADALAIGYRPQAVFRALREAVPELCAKTWDELGRVAATPWSVHQVPETKRPKKLPMLPPELVGAGLGRAAHAPQEEGARA